VISIINCFCGGLFLGICLLELLPESRQGVVRVLALAEINTPFPVTEFIIGSGLLLVMFIEHAVSDVCSRTSRNVDYDTMERRRSHEVRENEDCDFTEAVRSPPSSRRNSDVTSSESVRTLVLIGMLSIHSIFEGLALGLELNVASLIQLLLAVSVHKSVLAFGLGLRLFESFSDKLSTALACAIIFCTASPLGCVIGIFLTPLSSIPTTDAVSAVLECLATGTFLYVTFVEVIPSERKIKVRKLIKLLILLFGFGAIVGLQFI
uniref:Uncharacterized protein n=1 Tax=Ciona savignyi TaxID=51511 RepID=H2Z0U9_CIOSA